MILAVRDINPSVGVAGDVAVFAVLAYRRLAVPAGALRAVADAPLAEALGAKQSPARDDDGSVALAGAGLALGPAQHRRPR